MTDEQLNSCVGRRFFNFIPVRRLSRALFFFAAEKFVLNRLPCATSYASS